MYLSLTLLSVVKKRRKKETEKIKHTGRGKRRRRVQGKGRGGSQRGREQTRALDKKKKKKLTSLRVFTLPSIFSSFLPPLSLSFLMALHEFPDHLVAEIAKHLDAASDVLALERALEAATFPPMSPTKASKATTTKLSCSRSKQGFCPEQKEALSSSPNPRSGVEATTTRFRGQKVPGAGQENPARELDNDDENNNGNADDADDDPKATSSLPFATTTPTTPTPPASSLLEEVLRLRWRDAWILAGLPRKVGVEAGVACAYAAALAAAGGPRARACALAAGGERGCYSSDDEDGDGDVSEAASQGLFGMEMSPTPSSSSPPRSPSSVFFSGDRGGGDGEVLPFCCGNASQKKKKGKRRSSPPSSSSSPHHLPPAAAVAAALEALSLDAARLKQAARLSVAEALGPEPPLLRRAYRGFSYSPPEERGGLLLSEDDDDEEEEEVEGEEQGGVQAFPPSSASPPPRPRRSSPPSPPPPLPPPRLGEVSAEFLAWQTAAGHLSSAFSSRLARCAAAARGRGAAQELARSSRRSEEEKEREAEVRRKGKGVAAAA